MSKRDARRELQDLEEVFAALGHASRRHILLVLHLQGGRMTAGEIAGRFSCSWPTTTRHLRQLESAQLVEVEKAGRERVYRLNTTRLREVLTGWIGSFDDQRAPPSRSR